MNVIRKAEHLSSGDKLLLGGPTSSYTERVLSVQFEGKRPSDASIVVTTTNDQEGDMNIKTAYEFFPSDGVMVSIQGHHK